jgi:hypothetical protein
MAPVRAESATAKRPSARGFAAPSEVISVNIGILPLCAAPSLGGQSSNGRAAAFAMRYRRS